MTIGAGVLFEGRDGGGKHYFSFLRPPTHPYHDTVLLYSGWFGSCIMFYNIAVIFIDIFCLAKIMDSKILISPKKFSNAICLKESSKWKYGVHSLEQCIEI